MGDTPPAKIVKSRPQNANPDSRTIKDLNKQIILQKMVIADLRHKLSLIRDILNDTKIIDKKGMAKEIDKTSTTTVSSENNSKNIINIHIH